VFSTSEEERILPQSVEEDLLFFLHEFIYQIVAQLKTDFLFFIVMDNASMMDRASWRLFEMVTFDTEHLIVVMCLQSQPMPSQGFTG